MFASARLWLPVAVWAAVIFVLSSVQTPHGGLGVWGSALPKLAHLTEYAVLGALLLRATWRSRLVLTLGTLYALSDEFHQHFVNGRHGSLYDVAIDAVGVACGVVLWAALASRRVA